MQEPSHLLLAFAVHLTRVRQYFRPRHKEKEPIPLAQQRQLFLERPAVLQELMVVVS